MSQTLLLCVPFAGGGASFFHPWRRICADAVEVVALQLPGRERRFAEAPQTSVAEAVPDLVRQLPADIGQRRVALFGHSLGAVLAFELAIAIEQTGATVHRLFVSGSPAPFEVRETSALAASDTEFIDRVKQFAGYDHPALADPQLRDLILPVLRADVTMHESYRAEGSRSVRAPITVLRGKKDELVSRAAVAGWSGATSSSVSFEEIDGGHMYLADRGVEVVRLVSEQTAIETVA